MQAKTYHESSPEVEDSLQTGDYTCEQPCETMVLLDFRAPFKQIYRHDVTVRTIFHYTSYDFLVATNDKNLAQRVA
jgi:hypothetical protein